MTSRLSPGLGVQRREQMGRIQGAYWLARRFGQCRPALLFCASEQPHYFAEEGTVYELVARCLKQYIFVERPLSSASDDQFLYFCVADELHRDILQGAIRRDEGSAAVVGSDGARKITVATT